MRNVSAICWSTVLTISMTIAGMTGAPAKHAMKASSAALVAKGKLLISKDHCNKCHGADLKGKPGRTPSILLSGALHDYNQAKFVTLLSTGVKNDGTKIGPPMSNICKLSAGDGKALWAYISTQK